MQLGKTHAMHITHATNATFKQTYDLQTTNRVDTGQPYLQTIDIYMTARY